MASYFPTSYTTKFSNKSGYWLPIAIGLLALYGPTYYGLMTGLWGFEDQAHGPIVFMVVLYLIWQKREIFLPNSTNKPNLISGSIIFAIGLVCYIIGRSQDILLLDIGSQVFVFTGILLLTIGRSALFAMWFPLFFMLFMIPLPGIFLDAVTLPMKIGVSYFTELILFYFNYPIARSGVILQIGQYQLLVADACAGMHTLVSLEALGLLYLNLVKHDSVIRNISLAILIIPISFTANVIRVIVLTLVTYHFGDEAGQGFVHGFAGLVLFVVALMLIMSVDSLLQYFFKGDSKPPKLSSAKSSSLKSSLDLSKS